MSIFGQEIGWTSSVQNGCARTETREHIHGYHSNGISMNTVTRDENNFQVQRTTLTEVNLRLLTGPTRNDLLHASYGNEHTYVHKRVGEEGPIYLVIGIFSRADSVPKERIISIKYKTPWKAILEHVLGISQVERLGCLSLSLSQGRQAIQVIQGKKTPSEYAIFSFQIRNLISNAKVISNA